MKKKMILSLLLLNEAFHVAHAAPPTAIKEAQCRNPKGASVSLGVRKASIQGRFGTLKEMSNQGLQETFSISKDYPSMGWVALGGLAKDRSNRWGNLSVIVEANRDLSSRERLKVFFTDSYGKYQAEDVACILSF